MKRLLCCKKPLTDSTSHSPQPTPLPTPTLTTPPLVSLTTPFLVSKSISIPPHTSFPTPCHSPPLTPHPFLPLTTSTRTALSRMSMSITTLPHCTPSTPPPSSTHTPLISPFPLSLIHSPSFSHPSHCSPHSNSPDYILLSLTEVQTMPVIRRLGEGTFGVVDLIKYNKDVKVLKKMKRVNYATFIEEVKIQRKLDGAGGAPRIHAVCQEDSSVIMDYTGITYDKYINYATTRQKVHTLVKIAEALCEIHQKNIFHNDLKIDNITITVEEKDSTVHIIDFGKATDHEKYINRGKISRYWIAPEFASGGVTSAASDTYSFGQLVRDVRDYITDNGLILELFDKIVDMTTCEDPLHRVPLTEVVRVMNECLPIAN
ncbi:Megakaryocyte-associated tyrosine-protein kinase-like 1 [Homarus americanus]|uniref:Megakaryocyte-associated tyrosine-protein kinase-like 1 n=2 Tax=Homarus americanus TaxID=6706 RepID=A0A8J5MQQ9_HOMAM|nr:Megakaryocyte-associated tyrosine-protein kinase-like 1 [Homarus americanus]